MCMYVNLCEMASIVFNYHQCCPLALSLPGQRVKEQLQKARISVTINMCTPISKRVTVVCMRLSECIYPEVQSGSSFQSRLVFVIFLSEQLLLHTPSWLSIEGKHVQNIIMLQRYNNIPGPLYHFIFVFICTVHLIKTIVAHSFQQSHAFLSKRVNSMESMLHVSYLLSSLSSLFQLLERSRHHFSVSRFPLSALLVESPGSYQWVGSWVSLGSK